MTFGLIDEVIEDVVDRPADGGTEIEELAIDSMQRRFEKVALARVLRIEELEEVEDEGLINVSFREVGIEIGALHESEEKLVHDLQMGPSQLENRLVLFGVEGIACGIDRRGYGTEKVGRELSRQTQHQVIRRGVPHTYHFHDLWVYALGDDTALGGDVL